MSKKEVLIIIPAHNEEKTISGILEALEAPEISQYADVLVMDDGSTDGTNWLVKGRGHAVASHVFPSGYGNALYLGYKYAIRKDYKYVIQMDADGQHDVCNIPAIYSKLREEDENGNTPDIVLASRYMEGSSKYKAGLAKKAAYALFRGMIRLISGQKIADPTTGLQGLSKRALLYYTKYNNFDDRYPDANMVLQMLLLGFKVEQIPAVMHNRSDGKSMHSGLEPLLYMPRMILCVLAVAFRIRALGIDKNVLKELTVEK